MKRNFTDFDENKEIMGRRLTELMNMCGIGSTELARRITGYSKQTIYKYQKAVNSMPQEFIDKISDTLGIDKGYLSGEDRFACADYDEYMHSKKLVSDSDYNKYYSLFNSADLNLSSDMDNDSIEYHLSDKKDKKPTPKSFTADDMAHFYNMAVRLIRNLYNEYLSYDQPPQGKSANAWAAFMKWHPSYDLTEYLSNSEIKKVMSIMKEGDAND